MADAAPTDAPILSGSVPLYKQPEPLHRQRHRGLGLKFNDRPFDFLREAHFLPALMGEFGQASASYPIIFIGDNRNPVLVMGMREGENLFVNENGQFEADRYVPAFARRYPFVSATGGENQPSTVCIDRASPLISEKPDVPFFDENGEPTQSTKTAIEFVSAFDADALLTEQFTNKLKELDLLEISTVTVNAPQEPGGEPKPMKVAEYFAVGEKKLAGLSGDAMCDLRNSGFLGGIYAHMISLTRWDAILNRSLRRQQAAQSAAAVKN